MLQNALHQLNLEEVIQGCQDESTRPRSEEMGYCFELFRRAFEEEQQAAWLAIDEQYRRLMLRWVCDCSPGLPPQEVEQIVPQALPKFWHSLTRSAVPLTQRFAHVGAVLNYLKQCTISVYREHERRLRRRERVKQQLESGEYASPGQAVAEEDLLSRIDQERLLQRVRRWIQTCVSDGQEQRLLFLSYEVGLTPAEIVARYPQEFPDTQTVHRIKERILKRARRALLNGPDIPRNGHGCHSESGVTQAGVTHPNGFAKGGCHD
ncbi:MAG TPA: hypothetical protein VGD99_13550 [Anaerolineae bacterium]|jgi:hypothetical protein